METRERLFLRLLRFALGTEADCPKMRLGEWQAMFQMAKKQAVTGFVGSALINIGGGLLVEKDAKSQDAFTDLIMDWMGEVINITRLNHKVNNDVLQEFKKLEGWGLECCLLKGQGNAMMYPLPDSRISGDIDVWVRFKDSPINSENVKRIIKLVKEDNPKAKAAYHHIDAKDMNDTGVEVHYRPHFILSLLYNRRLQHFFIAHADEQFNHKVRFGDGVIAVPTPEFNAVFQLSHIYNHLTHEGIGLRHIIDYYYNLVELSKRQFDKAELEKTIRRMGLHNFAGAISWILIKALGMPESMALVDPDERRGKFILTDIFEGGNFGQHSFNRIAKRQDSVLKVQLGHLVRNAHLLRYFPHGALVEPLVRGLFFFKRKQLNKV